MKTIKELFVIVFAFFCMLAMAFLIEKVMVYIL